MPTDEETIGAEVRKSFRRERDPMTSADSFNGDPTMTMTQEYSRCDHKFPTS